MAEGKRWILSFIPLIIVAGAGLVAYGGLKQKVESHETRFQEIRSDIGEIRSDVKELLKRVK